MQYMPLDIHTSFDYGGWREGFEWPVNPNEILKFRKTIEKKVLECFVNEESDLCRTILEITCSALILEYLSLYNILLLLARIRLLGKTPAAEKQRPLWSLAKGLLNSGVPAQTMFYARGFRRDYKQNAKAFLHSLADYVAFIFEAKKPLDFNSSNNVSVFSLPFPLESAVNRKRGKILFRQELSWKWFPWDMGRKVVVPDAPLRDSIESLTDSVIDAFTDNELNLSQPIREHIYELTHNYYRQTASYYIGNRNSKDIPQHLWAGSGHNYYVRLLGRLVRDKKGVVTCFEHGEPKAIYKNTYHGYGELGICNRYMTYTRQCAQLYEDSWGGTLKLQKHMPEMITPPEEGEAYLKTVFRRYGKGKAISHNSKRVLYITSAFRNDFTSLDCRPADMVYLEWQRYLFNTLKELEYEVAFKQHPEGILINREFKLFKDVDYLNGNFKDHLERNNILIFDHTNSTAFAIAVCTNKPVVLIDTGFLSLHTESRKNLSERCAIANGYYDSQNRLRVKKDELQEALLSAAKSKNYDFSHRYLTGFGS